MPWKKCVQITSDLLLFLSSNFFFMEILYTIYHLYKLASTTFKMEKMKLIIYEHQGLSKTHCFLFITWEVQL